MDNPKEKLKNYYKIFKGEERAGDKPRKFPLALIASLALTILVFVMGRRGIISFNFLPEIPLPEYINFLMETYPYAIFGTAAVAIIVFSLTLKSFKSTGKISGRRYWEKSVSFIHYVIAIPAILIIIAYTSLVTILLGFTPIIENFVAVLMLLVSFLLYEYFTTTFLIPRETKKRFKADSYEKLKEKTITKGITPLNLTKIILLGLYSTLVFYLLVANSGTEALIMLPATWIFLVVLMNLSRVFKIFSKKLSAVKVELRENIAKRPRLKEEPKEAILLGKGEDYVKLMFKERFPNWSLVNKENIEIMDFQEE